MNFAKSLIGFSLFSFVALASHFQITMNRGYFKNSFSLADTQTKTETIYLLSRLTNGDVRKMTVLTQRTFESMRNDFIQITDSLKNANKRKIASCSESVTISAQGKEKYFCTSSLSKDENKKLEAWLDKARFYSGLKK